MSDAGFRIGSNISAALRGASQSPTRQQAASGLTFAARQVTCPACGTKMPRSAKPKVHAARLCEAKQADNALRAAGYLECGHLWRRAERLGQLKRSPSGKVFALRWFVDMANDGASDEQLRAEAVGRELVAGFQAGLEESVK